MRLFFGIELDPASRAQIAAVTAGLCRLDVFRGAVVTWVRPSRLHLTLAFLGEVGPDLATQVRRVAEERLTLTPFCVEVGTLGAFPHSGVPRALWLGVTKGEAELAEVHATLWRRLASLSLTPERRRFAAHLTLGRVKRTPRGRGRAMRDALGDVAVPTIAWTVNQVRLYESRLASSGPSYHLVHHARLADGGGPLAACGKNCASHRDPA